MTRPTWVSLPQAPNDAPCTATLFDGDDYLIRLSSGEVLWATWTVNSGSYFARLDHLGEAVGQREGDGISGVCAVMTAGYSRENIAAVFGRAQSPIDRVVAHTVRRVGELLSGRDVRRVA